MSASFSTEIQSYTSAEDTSCVESRELCLKRLLRELLDDSPVSSALVPGVPYTDIKITPSVLNISATYLDLYGILLHINLPFFSHCLLQLSHNHKICWGGGFLELPYLCYCSQENLVLLESWWGLAHQNFLKDFSLLGWILTHPVSYQIPGSPPLKEINR